MRIEFHLMETERKELVKAISEITGIEAVYRYAPTFAYEIGCFTVTKDGALEFDDKIAREEIEKLLKQLESKGFTFEEQDSSIELTVEIPADKVNIENLRNLLTAKGKLIKKALGLGSLEFEILNDRIIFPWFQKVDSENVKIYTEFISALCAMSKKQKRVSAKTKETDNEKYAFRCFLLRLGFIGKEYKTERKLLLKNLTGSSAFKGGKRNEFSKKRDS